MDLMFFVIGIVLILVIGTWLIITIIRNSRKERKKDLETLEVLNSYRNVLEADKKLAEGLLEEE